MKEYFKQAAREMKKTSSLTGAAIIEAMGPVLDLFTIVVNDFLQISFTSLTHAMTGYLYGPVVGCMAGGVADIIKYLIKPTGTFFPGFTLNEMLSGFIYGCFFYKKEIKLHRVITARICVVVTINLILIPLWLSIMYGNAYKVMVATRIIKNIVQLPVDIFVLYTILKFGEKNIKGKTIK